MAKELNEDTGFRISIKTLGGIAAMVGMWYSLQAEIAEAKELPVIEIPDPEVTRMEFDMKDQMIRQTIMTTQEDVKEIKKSIEKIEDKLYE
jgi:precorrin-2 methylase